MTNATKWLVSAVAVLMFFLGSLYAQNKSEQELSKLALSGPVIVNGSELREKIKPGDLSYAVRLKDYINDKNRAREFVF